MASFNSLGSNYDGKLIWKSLFGTTPKSALATLSASLGKRYDGEATLTYKGRQALELALRQSDLPTGSAVAINGFTCFVVYQAVINAGYEAVFLDVAPEQLNFSRAELEGALRKHKNIKAVIVQNTLGYPCEMSEIESLCKREGLVLIEDLAHSIGSRYADKKEAGTVGQFTMLSFSQDKPLDAVAGGALIDRRPKQSKATDLVSVSLSFRLKNRFYPFWATLIRRTYPLGIGRYLHYILRKTRALATPMSDNLSGIQRMTKTAASLVLARSPRENAERAHRQKIAAIYQKVLPVAVQVNPLTGTSPLYLRFAILVSERQKLIDHLRQFQIYIGDTWYDAPIAPKRYLAQTSYHTGDCPRAEHVAADIVNLPTHINISERRARFIAEKVNIWLESK